jgi:hypothetical protein
VGGEGTRRFRFVLSPACQNGPSPVPRSTLRSAVHPPQSTPRSRAAADGCYGGRATEDGQPPHFKTSRPFEWGSVGRCR